MITTKNDSVRLYGLSTDDKPVDGIINGTIFVEIDTSDEYYFNEAAGTWVKKNSSVGGGLPTPTMADNGKAVVVSATVTEGAVIVPEQIGEITEDGNWAFVCNNAVMSLFTEGTQVIAYEDGNRYERTIADQDGTLGFSLDDTYDSGFYLDNGQVIFFDVAKEDGTEVTVKLVVRGADSYSFGFGLRGLKVTASKGVVIEDGYFMFADDDMTLDKTWAEISSAVESGVPVYLVADIDGLQDTEAKTIWQLQSYGYRTNEYMVTFTITSQSGASVATFVASTPDGTLMP